MTLVKHAGGKTQNSVRVTFRETPFDLPQEQEALRPFVDQPATGSGTGGHGGRRFWLRRSPWNIGGLV
jgi:hypothetical protein